MKHIIWVFIHLGAFFIFPFYGASLTLLAYLFSEIIGKVIGDKKFNVIHFYFLGLIITVLANINIIFSFESDNLLSNYFYAIPSLFPKSSLILALGTQFLAFGYFFKTNLKFPILYLKQDLTPTFFNIIFSISFALALKNLWLSLNLPGSFQTIIDFTPIVGIFILSRFAGKYSKTDLYIKAFLIMIASSLNALFFSYLRIEILLPILVFIIGYFLGSGSIKSIISFKFIPILLIILLFYSFFEMFGSERSKVGVGLERITEFQVSSSLDSKSMNELSVFNRSSNISQISAACGLVEDRGHYNGIATLPLLVAFVPRFLWPEKPVIALGVWYALEIGAAVEVNDWFNNSVNMTIPGHLFLDFSWFGLVFGSFIVGLILKLLWDTIGFYQKRFNFLGVFFGVYLIMTAFLGLGADLQIIVTYFAFYLSLLFISKILIKIK